MGDEPATQSELTAEDRSEDAGDGIDNEVVQEVVEGEAEPGTTWIADGEKYRCPECEAVHEEPGGSCDVCGWVPG